MALRNTALTGIEIHSPTQFLLAPEPGGLGLWTLPNFASLGEIARELEEVNGPVELVRTGVYVDIGAEVV